MGMHETGRSDRHTVWRLRPYLLVLAQSRAGVIELEPFEDPVEVECSLQLAASILDQYIVTGWLGVTREVLAWRRWHERPAPGLQVLSTNERGDAREMPEGVTFA